MYLNNESGRSMVEMLGVLAVIGVLSVAGITGFKNAMDKNKANTIINEAQKRATLVVPQIQLQNNANPTLNEFSNNNLGYAEFDTKVYTKADNLPDGQFGIKVSGVGKEICQNILNTLEDNTVIRRLSITDAPTTALTTCGETNTFLMVYNNDMTTKPVAGEYTFDTCPESFYPCATTTSCVASENDCPSICALDEDLSSGCVCPERRDRTGNKCGDCVDEEVYRPWTQPVLTSNGTMGSSDFACNQSSVLNDNHFCWKAFDNEVDKNLSEDNSYWHSRGWGGWTNWISWYTKNPIKIKTLTIRNRVDDAPSIKNFSVEYSDDNSTWTSVFSATHSKGSLSSISYSINADSYHNYWRLYITSGYSTGGAHEAIDELIINADELQTTNYEMDSSGQCVKAGE